MSLEEIYLGNHAFVKGSQKVFLKDEARREHCHIIGGTGTGKSKLMEHMIRQDIENGKGICLIDPHGNLYEAILKWAVAYGFRHRLVVIDPNEKDWTVGLNFLEYDQDLFDAGQHVENVIYEIGRARDEDIFATAQVVIWLRNFLQLAAIAHLTLGEVYHLLNENNKALRQRLTEGIKGDPELQWHFQEAWNEYDSASKSTRAEIMKLPVWSRIQTFRATPTMRRITGQSQTTVDFYKAMEKGQIVLVNLHGRISDYERNLLGVIVIDKLFQAAQRRKPGRGNPFFVYIDEFGYFVSERIAHALEELRKRQVSFVLAHQELEQLSEGTAAGRRLLAAIMTNAKIKIAFRVSRSDAEAMMLEMFAGQIHGDNVKFEQKVISFWPKETTRTSHGFSRSEMASEMMNILESASRSSSIGSGQVYAVPGVGFLDADMISQSLSQGTMSGFATAQGRGSSRGYSTSEVEVEFPFYELIPFEQVVSTTFYTVEEMKEQFIQFLQNQADRFFHLKILGQTDRPPIALVTPTVEGIEILPSLWKKARLEAVKRCGRPVEEVDRQTAERRQQLLKLQDEPEHEDSELDNFDQDTYEPEQ